MKFKPPELALIVATEKPVGQAAANLQYVGQVCTVLGFIGQLYVPFLGPTQRSDYWRVKLLDGYVAAVVEPWLQKLPPPPADDEDTNEETKSYARTQV